MKYGYARVSSNGQEYDGQVEALKAAGCERVYCDKASGKSIGGRREFERLMKALVPGDTVVVTKLDRLARSSRDLQNILHELQALFLRLPIAWGNVVRHHDRRWPPNADDHGWPRRVRARLDPETMR